MHRCQLILQLFKLSSRSAPPKCQICITSDSDVPFTSDSDSDSSLVTVTVMIRSCSAVLDGLISHSRVFNQWDLGWSDGLCFMRSLRKKKDTGPKALQRVQESVQDVVCYSVEGPTTEKLCAWLCMPCMTGNKEATTAGVRMFSSYHWQWSVFIPWLRNVLTLSPSCCTFRPTQHHSAHSGPNPHNYPWTQRDVCALLLSPPRPYT